MSDPAPARRLALRALDAAWPVLSLVLLLAILGLVTKATGSLLLERQATTMLMYVVVVVGLSVFVGNSGVLSFGHITFMAVGAYVTAFVTMPPGIKEAVFSKLPSLVAKTQLAPLEGVLIGGAAAALLAAALAFPFNRLPPVSLGLAMFALLLTSNIAIRQGTALITGGQTSVFGIPAATTLWSAFAFAGLAIVAAYLLQRSRIGLRLRATREDEAAAVAMGINVTGNRAVAFIISAFVVGVGGGMFVQFIGALSPDTLFFDTTLITLAMLVVGGIGSLAGAVVGTVVLSAAITGLQQLEDGFSVAGVNVPARPGLTAVGLGLFMLLTIIFRPRGLTGSKEVPPLSSWKVVPRRLRRLEPVDGDGDLVVVRESKGGQE